MEWKNDFKKFPDPHLNVFFFFIINIAQIVIWYFIVKKIKVIVIISLFLQERNKKQEGRELLDSWYINFMVFLLVVAVRFVHQTVPSKVNVTHFMHAILCLKYNVIIVY